MRRIFLITLIGTALFSSMNAQIPGVGECPKVLAVHNFSLSKYLGLWYEVKKYPFVFTIGAKCVTAEYGLNPNGTVSVFNRQLRDGKEETILGSARIITENLGELGVTFPNIPVQREANYKVIGTDYANFAVVFSCSSFLNLLHGRIVWVLTRARFPPQSVLDQAYGVLKINGLSTGYLATTDNEGCPSPLNFSNNRFVFN